VVTVSTVVLPQLRPDDAEVVVPAPGRGAGFWAGAPSATRTSDGWWLAYRIRRPDCAGSGVAVVLARSDDGVRFEPVATVDRDVFGAASLERSALVALPGGGWRLFVSCATPDSRRWWIDSLEAGSVRQLPSGRRRVVLPCDRSTGFKDPIIEPDVEGGWRMWVCCHPLTEAGHEDRMTTRLLTSPDGLAWRDHGEVLAGRAGRWDARGARVTTVVAQSPLTVLYDGRPDAESNWHETTGVARWDGIRLVADDADPVASPYSDGAWRYASAVPLPDGRTRFYVEAARPDGAHDLVTCVR